MAVAEGLLPAGGRRGTLAGGLDSDELGGAATWALCRTNLYRRGIGACVRNATEHSKKRITVFYCDAQQRTR